MFFNESEKGPKMDPGGVPGGSRGYGWVRIFEDLLIAAVIAPKTHSRPLS